MEASNRVKGPTATSNLICTPGAVSKSSVASAMEAAEFLELLEQIKRLAFRYYRMTGKPLGVTGEVGEFEAARLLDLKLVPPRQAGFDAIGPDGHRYQIKSRCYAAHKRSQRVGSIRFNYDWDSVLLVLLDPDMRTRQIWEASRADIRRIIEAPGSKARNERKSLAVSQFRRVATLRWPQIHSAPPSDEAKSRSEAALDIK